MGRRRVDDIPDVPWSDFWPGFAGSWQQGEHVTLIGPTGQGKTTLGLALVELRGWTVVLGTKPVDGTLSALPRRVWTRVDKWPPPPTARRVLLWPRMRTIGDRAHVADAIRHALETIYTAGGWCIFADELRYLTKDLGLQRECETIWLHGRSLGISLVVASQRPAFIPLEAYDQASHLFFWRDNDERNLKRIGGIGWLDAGAIRRAVATLRRHEVLYVCSRDGTLARTRPDLG